MLNLYLPAVILPDVIYRLAESVQGKCSEHGKHCKDGNEPCFG